jgi:phosphoglycerate dehydrogenase-like enzyme
MKIWSNTSTLNGLIDDLEFTEDTEEAEIALIGSKSLDLDKFPCLKGIFKTGVGRDNVPVEQAWERGIVCAFPSPATAEYIYSETASFTCSLILDCLYQDVGDFSAWQKRSRPALQSRELLVLGVGNIGQRVASRMSPFMKVIKYDATTHEFNELEPLMRRADCISLHMPLTAETRSFIDETKLGWMKDGASLVNTARGAIVDEDALSAELRAERLWAAFDVFWTEPYVGKLLESPSDRFSVTPHIASTCSDFLTGTAKDFRAFLSQLQEPV